VVEVTFEPVTAADIEELVANMRQADRDEIAASGTPDPEEAITFSCASSSWCRAVRFDGKLACIFGVGCVSLLTGTGAPWLLGTDVITKNQRAFIKHSRPYIRRMLQTYPRLVNMVDARNTRAIRWLERMGFKLYGPTPTGVQGLPFHPFEMRA